MNWQISQIFRSGLSYEYIRAKFDEGDYEGSKVPLVAEGLFRLFFEIKPTDQLTVTLGSSFVGESYRGSDFENAENKLEAYWLCDFGFVFMLSDRATLFGESKIYSIKNMYPPLSAQLYTQGRQGKRPLVYAILFK